MSPKSSSAKKPAEQVVKDIRRATRRYFSAEDKIRIVLDGLRGEDSIAELCRKEGIAQSYIQDQRMSHVRGAPMHPQTQGKIERWHQTLKNRILLENYFLPGDLEAQIGTFVEHYNHRRYHESLGNVTPADAYFGRASAIIKQRERIKRQTIQHRRLQHRKLAA
ncbi:Integrase core domain-containing protein [Aquamicrobium aerolatum DSM 21857]|uniref:Integrase core domain-containing protein n=1 Tax=Aquamicrobium aerolatum DSM 21857 TaxID=1121003 RepID=A0A1I3R7G1_9HYPH|nr:Integrase core domain-containing protein [Aquamicrobium aerolatum DSM 21857]